MAADNLGTEGARASSATYWHILQHGSSHSVPCFNFHIHFTTFDLDPMILEHFYISSILGRLMVIWVNVSVVSSNCLKFLIMGAKTCISCNPKIKCEVRWNDPSVQTGADILIHKFGVLSQQPSNLIPCGQNRRRLLSTPWTPVLFPWVALMAGDKITPTSSMCAISQPIELITANFAHNAYGDGYTFRNTGRLWGEFFCGQNYVYIGPVMRSCCIFFFDSQNKLLNKQLRCWWIATPQHSCDVTVIVGCVSFWWCITRTPIVKSCNTRYSKIVWIA